MNQDRYVAALEISSSKIIGVVGRYNGDGQLTIEVSEEEEIKDIVRYGMIQNLEETALRVSRIVDKLQRRPSIAPREIDSVFIGLSGRSLHSIETSVSLDLPEETEIDANIVERLRNDALQSVAHHGMEIIDAVPRIYKVNNDSTASPVGSMGTSVSVTYDVIVCRPELKRNLQRTIEDKCGLKVEGFVISSLATAHLILTGEEKRLGCMLVDMGAETTSVSIYHKGSLCYFATLPLGGRNITRDLTTLSLLEERAEEIKVTSGNAIARENPSTLNLGGVRLSDVSNYIVARAEEIVANIVEQISYAGLKEKDLPGGIICIGGASKLNGMNELLARQSGLNVRTGRLPEYIHMTSPSIPALEEIEVDCVLYEGASQSESECLSIHQREDVPATGVSDTTTLPKGGSNTDGKGEDVGKPQKAGNPKFRRLIDKMHTRISHIFAPPQDSDSDLLE